MTETEKQAERREVAERIVAWITQFVAGLDPTLARTLAVWALHTWWLRLWHATPYVAVTGGPGCGKTTLMEVLCAVVRDGEWISVPGTTMGGILNAIDPADAAENAQPATLFLDECEKLARPNPGELGGMLNSGYVRDGVIRRADPKRPVRKTWGAKCFAQIGDFGDTLASRSIRVLMASGAARAAMRWPGLYEGKIEAAELRERAERVAREQIDEVIPTHLHGRTAQIWTPLLSVAAAIGADWLADVEAASVDLAVSAGTTEKRGTLARVATVAERVEAYAPDALRDLASVFGDDEVLTSPDAIARMKAIRLGPWRGIEGTGLTPVLLSALVDRYGIIRRNADGEIMPIKWRGKTIKGFRRTVVREALERQQQQQQPPQPA